MLLKPLSKIEIETVRKTWAIVDQRGDYATELLYQNLFKAKPELRALFKNEGRHSMVEPVRRLVDGIEDLPKLLPYVKQLAIMHVQFGVKKEDYQVVGPVFIQTLKQVVGPEFTHQDELVWRKVYGVLSGVMISYAYPSLGMRVLDWLLQRTLLRRMA